MILKEHMFDMRIKEVNVMGEYLPGDLNERLVELRKTHGYKSQQQLVDALDGFIDKATYSRIENGTTRTINNELLVKLARLYNVSTDYICGISDFPEKTYFDIEQLGLTVPAAMNLYSGKVDARVINELLLNDKFAGATRMIALFFSNSIVKMLQAQNSLLDFSLGLVSEYTDSVRKQDDKEIKELKKRLEAAKMPPSHVELDRISRQIMAAIREIKKKTEKEVADVTETTEKLNYEIIETVKAEIAKHPNMRSLPEEEKKEIVIDAVMRGIEFNGSITEEQQCKLEPAIRQIMPALFDLWKEN